jgi:hypothetical protein
MQVRIKPDTHPPQALDDVHNLSLNPQAYDIQQQYANTLSELRGATELITTHVNRHSNILAPTSPIQ